MRDIGVPRRLCARIPSHWMDRGTRCFGGALRPVADCSDPPAEGEPDDLSWLQRLRLCVAAQDPAIRDRCDIGLSEILQTPEAHLRDNIVKAGLMKGYAHRGEFLKHKFVVDIDGNSNSWSGLFLTLYGGVLCVESRVVGRISPVVLRLARSPGSIMFLIEGISAILPKSRLGPPQRPRGRTIARRGRELAVCITLEDALEVSARNLHVWLARRSAAG